MESLLSNVPLEWRPYLNKKTTSNFEVIRIVYTKVEHDENGDSVDAIQSFDSLNDVSVNIPSNSPFVAFVRVKSCKRNLSFQQVGWHRNNDIQYFLELPDLLFIINCDLIGNREIETSSIQVFGLNSENQLLDLPLPNLDVYDRKLCCEEIITNLKKSDDFKNALMKHFKEQVAEFFTSKFTCEGFGSLSCYTKVLDSAISKYERLHEILKNWSEKTKKNKKLTFKKYKPNPRNQEMLEQNILDFINKIF